MTTRQFAGARSARAIFCAAVFAALGACGGGGGSGNTSSSGASGQSGAAATVPLATTANGPAISVQPAAQTVSVGQRAFFSVAASGATAYQWYKNGAAIAGANAASYESTAAVSGD